jgi:protein-disulfide isomerase
MQANRLFSAAVQGILAVCAVVVTALVVRRELFLPPVPSAPTTEARHVDDWKRYGASGNRLDPDGAAATIVVFSDYQCPACRALASQLQTIRAEFPGRVAVVMRNAPLQIHPFAIPAARAGECAARQGRFAAFHDALFASQGDIGVVPWPEFAQRARVGDVEAFERCRTGSAPEAALRRDQADARSLGVTATPTYLINDLEFVGTMPLDSLRAHVRRAVAGSR